MFGITRLILNLSIGAKLGIASGLGVLLVATLEQCAPRVLRASLSKASRLRW